MTLVIFIILHIVCGQWIQNGLVTQPVGSCAFTDYMCVVDFETL